uniref:Uncharacterized protein n=1 Tax=Glycine max TaxID=3847 RepID=A0A0R0FEQ4_SOYBN
MVLPRPHQPEGYPLARGGRRRHRAVPQRLPHGENRRAVPPQDGEAPQTLPHRNPTRGATSPSPAGGDANTNSPSSWVHFKSMDSMEKGPNHKPHSDINNNLNFHDDDDDDYLYEEFKTAPGSNTNTRSLNKLYKNNNGFNSGGSGSGSGFRIRIPAGVPQQQHTASSNKIFNSHLPPGIVPRGGGVKRERERDAVAEMVEAIKVLRDGFVRMEQMKMEMAREIESMRMEMEMKRTEMILDSQQRIVEAFAMAVSQKRSKGKSTPSPSSQP